MAPLRHPTGATVRPTLTAAARSIRLETVPIRRRSAATRRLPAQTPRRRAAIRLLLILPHRVTVPVAVHMAAGGPVPTVVIKKLFTKTKARSA